MDRWAELYGRDRRYRGTPAIPNRFDWIGDPHRVGTGRADSGTTHHPSD